MRFALSLALLLLLPAAGSSQEPSPPPDATAPADTLFGGLAPDTSRGIQLIDAETRARRHARLEMPDKEAAIRVGEKLTFSVRWKMIRAGEATMEIAGIEKVHGHPCYHVISKAKSNSFFDAIYKVRDTVESWMDEDFLYSWRFRKRLNEGSYHTYQEIDMDQDNGLASYQDGRVYEFPRGAHDVLSAFYYIRTQNLEPGKTFDLDSHADRKNYPLVVHVGQRERVETPAGDFDCIVVEPMLRTPGLFKHEGSLTIWLTDDERRMPVIMKSKIPVGSITVILTDYRRPE